MTSSAPRRHGRDPGHIIRLVRHRLGNAAIRGATAHVGGDRLLVDPDRLIELVTFLRNDPDSDLQLLVALVGLDVRQGARRHAAHSVEHTQDRRHDPQVRNDVDDDGVGFEVHYQLRSPRLGYRALVQVRVHTHNASIPSLTPLFAAAETMERELFEMVGLYPEGHPKLRPVLLYPGFNGHPLRKDYDANRQQPLVAPRDGAGDWASNAASNAATQATPAAATDGARRPVVVFHPDAAAPTDERAHGATKDEPTP